MKNKELNKNALVELDEKLLDAVSGGTSETETENEQNKLDIVGVLSPIQIERP